MLQLNSLIEPIPHDCLIGMKKQTRQNGIVCFVLAFANRFKNLIGGENDI